MTRTLAQAAAALLSAVVMVALFASADGRAAQQFAQAAEVMSVDLALLAAPSSTEACGDAA